MEPFPANWARQLDPVTLEQARRKARHFIDHETAFHLGVLPTEQSNPKTVGFAETAHRDLPAAIGMLQAVDADIAPKAAEVFSSGGFQHMVEAMCRVLRHGGRVCFSGCGATGRLSILLEAAWRRFWQELQPHYADTAGTVSDLENRVLSLMTGGDYALIRSVENFEDYAVFGRQQVREAAIGQRDLLIAITEGGETSSVIGTVWQALENGADVFFVFNNPADVLARHIERSRSVIEDPRVKKLDLASGPMAVAGSTRMQATTSELLVVGAALDIALARTLGTHVGRDAGGPWSAFVRSPREYYDRFVDLLSDLGSPAAVAAMAAMVQYEQEIYRAKGRVTYFADECLLDIFTDTTERSPTFMLPRFRPCDDRIAPAPWAFVKHPLLRTPQAWRQVLRRRFRCLAWDAQAYRKMGAPAAIADNPPQLDADQMLKFLIGNEEDRSRSGPPPTAAILIVLGDEAGRMAASGDPLRAAFSVCAERFSRRAVLAIGPTAAPAGSAPDSWHVPVRLPDSPLRLWDRLAVKLVLNTVSTATMACMDRLVSNWMVHVETTNKKLIDRGTRLVSELAGVDYPTACYALHETIEQLERTRRPDEEKPSAVALTIARLKASSAEAP